MFLNAVFQGGGVKGIALVGALEKFEELNIQFDAVSGTSAGSIVAALYASGYKASEIKRILEETDLVKLLDPFKFKYFRIFRNKGLYKGEKLYNWIYTLLAKKEVYTFSDIDKVELKIVASDLTNRELIIFDSNNNPNLKIAEAVRMSISIPFFFKPYPFGEKLVVDGGVLSNYPLFTFNDPENTLGFKIVSHYNEAPNPPSTIAGFIWSMAETMMDAHDKDDEKRSEFKNVIKINNAGIPSIKFNLSEEEKILLYQNGYHAASKFIAENSDFFEKIKNRKLIVSSGKPQSFIIQTPDNLQANESIRVSISALFRICVDGKYLLIKGNRINQFQPIGGVLKRYETAKSLMRELSVSDDDKFAIDSSSRDDLRVRIPFSSLVKFLEWYQTKKDRETSPWREFYEELIESQILPSDIFKYIYYEHIKSHIEGIRFSQHFNCHELLIAEIFELVPTISQLEHLRNSLNNKNEQILWCERQIILTRGYDQNTKSDLARISEHSAWIL